MCVCFVEGSFAEASGLPLILSHGETTEMLDIYRNTYGLTILLLSKVPSSFLSISIKLYPNIPSVHGPLVILGSLGQLIGEFPRSRSFVDITLIFRKSIMQLQDYRTREANTPQR